MFLILTFTKCPKLTYSPMLAHLTILFNVCKINYLSTFLRALPSLCDPEIRTPETCRFPQCRWSWWAGREPWLCSKGWGAASLRPGACFRGPPTVSRSCLRSRKRKISTCPWNAFASVNSQDSLIQITQPVSLTKRRKLGHKNVLQILMWYYTFSK